MTRLLHTAASALVAMSVGAGAAPLVPGTEIIAPGVAPAILRHETHGCHYDCECGPLKDFSCEQVYHRHLHMLCLPVRCGGDTKCEQTPPEGVCRHIPPQ
jgi:hypothetical protein